jgi:hypothetical protein
MFKLWFSGLQVDKHVAYIFRVEVSSRRMWFRVVTMQEGSQRRHLYCISDPEDGDSIFRRNVGKVYVLYGHGNVRHSEGNLTKERPCVIGADPSPMWVFPTRIRLHM